MSLPGCKATAANEVAPGAVAFSSPAATAAAADTAQVTVTLPCVYGAMLPGLVVVMLGVKVRSSVTGTVAVVMLALVTTSNTRNCRLSWKVEDVLVATKGGSLMTA